VISDNGRGFDAKVKKKGIGFKYAFSNKECHGEFQIKSKGRYNYYHYHSNRTKNTYIEMTIESAPTT
jgi:hypothetical protein